MSGYDGWPFDEKASVVCVDCERVSPEIRYVNDLLDWIDEHTAACQGYDAGDDD